MAAENLKTMSQKLSEGINVLEAESEPQTVIELDKVSAHYGEYEAVRDATFLVPQNLVTAIIGPSGCGKSTVLRSINRMNDLVDSFRLNGKILYRGQDIYDSKVDPVEVRRRIGMVFQKPNPFPKSIYDNVTYGPKVNKIPKADFDEIVERSLRSAALWDEVKDRLDDSALGLSGGQQQRLCIARAIATNPDVVLMDEPCSALDPIATGRIEELISELQASYSIVIVTHNMAQARRVSNYCAFFSTITVEHQDRHVGSLIEFDKTARLFDSPRDQRTLDYIAGKFG